MSRLVGEPTHLQKYHVKLDHHPQVGMKIKKYLSCYHPAYMGGGDSPNLP